jgi:hypothetical protein
MRRYIPEQWATASVEHAQCSTSDMPVEKRLSALNLLPAGRTGLQNMGLRIERRDNLCRSICEPSTHCFHCLQPGRLQRLRFIARETVDADLTFEGASELISADLLAVQSAGRGTGDGRLSGPFWREDFGGSDDRSWPIPADRPTGADP